MCSLLSLTHRRVRVKERLSYRCGAKKPGATYPFANAARRKQSTPGANDIVSFYPGTLSLCNAKSPAGAEPKKLLPKFIGPFQIVKQKGPLTFLVEDVPIARGPALWRRFKAHVSQMRPFRVPEEPSMVASGSESSTGVDCDDLDGSSAPPIYPPTSPMAYVDEEAIGLGDGAALAEVGSAAVAQLSDGQIPSGDGGLTYQGPLVEQGSDVEQPIAVQEVLRLPTSMPPDPKTPSSHRPVRERRLPRRLGDFEVELPQSLRRRE